MTEWMRDAGTFFAALPSLLAGRELTPMTKTAEDEVGWGLATLPFARGDTGRDTVNTHHRGAERRSRGNLNRGMTITLHQRVNESDSPTNKSTAELVYPRSLNA